MKLSAIAAVTALLAGPVAAEPFKFVALGDMPYGPPAEVYPPFEALIDKINARGPAFVLHVGDTKSGSTSCDDAMLRDQLDFMNRFEAALIYTPGDNEWTDCHRFRAGAFDPVERLGFIRREYFPTAMSLGQAPIQVERQGDLMPEHAKFVENARFQQDGVFVITAHVVGSNNGFEPRDLKAAEEFYARDAANIAWTWDSFAAAKAAGAKAVVMAIHAQVLDAKTYYADFPRHSGHKAWVEAFLTAAQDFGGPVLFIHGDSHRFRIDRPFRRERRVIENITRLEVFGAREMHAVEVSVDPDSPDPFAFRPIRNPALPR